MQVQSDDFRKVIRVFIASPSGLEEERRLFRDIVDEMNQLKADGMGLLLKPLGWEDVPPGVGRPQGLIDKYIEECDLMVMLLWTRWGTPTGEYSSGFEEEYEMAKRLHDTGGKPEIMLYFRKVPDDVQAEPDEQLRQVLKFKEKIKSERAVMYKPYDDENEWGRLFRLDLSKRLDESPFVDYRTDDEIRRIRAKLSHHLLLALF